MIYLKILGIIIIAIILVTIVKETNQSFSTLITIAIGIIIIIFSIGYISDILTFLQAILNKSNINKEYFYILIKVIIIAYLTEFVSQFAIDNSQTSLASKTQLVGKIAIFYVSLPIITSVFKTIEAIL